MNAKEISDLRAILAAQSAADGARPPKLGVKLSRILAPRINSKPLNLSGPPSPQSVPSRREMAGEETTLLLGDDLAFYDLDIPPIDYRPPAADPIPPEILLGAFCPRRPEFGQRTEPVLDLHVPAPAAPRRLMLIAMGGQAVGEITMHDGDTSPIPELTRRSIHRLHSETPFFPEDLADDRPAPHHFLPLLAPAERLLPSIPPEPPSTELASAFLLATLAARLASEEAGLNQKLASLLVPALAA